MAGAEKSGFYRSAEVARRVQRVEVYRHQRVTMTAFVLAFVFSVNANAGLFTDNWMPNDELYPLDVKAVKDVIRANLVGCRLEAGYAERGSGAPFDWDDVVACMGDRGWVRGSAGQRRSWIASCPRPSQIRAERRVAIAHWSGPR